MGEQFSRPSRRNRRRMGMGPAITLVLVSGVLAVGGLSFAGYAYFGWQTAASAHSQALQERDAFDAKAAQQEESAKKAADEQAATRQANAEAALEAGFFPSPDDPDVFWTDNGGGCDMFMSCVQLVVSVAKDCPHGVYIAANVEDQGVVMASGNDITGALQSGQSAVAPIRFPGWSSGGEYEVTSAHCM